MHCGSDQQGCDQGVLVQKGAVERHNRGKDYGDCVGHLLGGKHFVLWGANLYVLLIRKDFASNVICLSHGAGARVHW